MNDMEPNFFVNNPGYVLFMMIPAHGFPSTLFTILLSRSKIVCLPTGYRRDVYGKEVGIACRVRKIVCVLSLAWSDRRHTGAEYFTSIWLGSNKIIWLGSNKIS